MNREEHLHGPDQRKLFESIMVLHDALDSVFLDTYQRSVPFNEVFVDRWERAKKLKFGEGTSIYDSSLVLGSVTIGRQCWIGPFTIMDGSGGLTIGDHCTVSAGCQLYTHDNVRQTLTGGKAEIDRAPLTIGDRSYIGPNAVIAKGITIGSGCVIAAHAYVNKDVPDNTIVGGQPARPLGRVSMIDGKVVFDYASQHR